MAGAGGGVWGPDLAAATSEVGVGSPASASWSAALPDDGSSLLGFDGSLLDTGVVDGTTTLPDGCGRACGSEMTGRPMSPSSESAALGAGIAGETASGSTRRGSATGAAA